VTFKNDTTYGFTVSFQGESDSEFGGTYTIPPKGEARISLVPGRYRVRARRADGAVYFLSWREYSSHSEAYHITLCAICAPVGEAAPAVVSTPVPRLGVSVTDSEIGVRVLHCGSESPADNMRSYGDSGIRFYIEPLNSIITRVNSQRIENAIEFLTAIADSPERCELTLFSTTRGTTVEYWTMLR